MGATLLTETPDQEPARTCRLRPMERRVLEDPCVEVVGGYCLDDGAQRPCWVCNNAWPGVKVTPEAAARAAISARFVKAFSGRWAQANNDRAGCLTSEMDKGAPTRFHKSYDLKEDHREGEARGHIRCRMFSGHVHPGERVPSKGPLGIVKCNRKRQSLLGTQCLFGKTVQGQHTLRSR